jgi:hypothetical protein
LTGFCSLLNLVKLGRKFQFQIFHTAGDIMLNRIALIMGLLVLTTVSSASAAVVGFKGVLTNIITAPGNPNQGLPLGDFTLNLNSIDGNPAFVTSGQFIFGFGTGGATTVGVFSGSIQAPANGVLIFNLTSPGVPVGAGNTIVSNFTFTGVSGVVAGAVTQATLDNLGSQVYTTSFAVQNVDNGGTLSAYSGTISSVPEPGSVLALCGLSLGAAGWRWRKRRS